MVISLADYKYSTTKSTGNNNNLPPQNLEAEEAILGGILLDPDAMDRVIDILEAPAFYVKSHREIYQACVALYKKNCPTDLTTVTSYLMDKKTLDQIGGTSKLAQLVDPTVSAVNIDRYVALVMDKYARRQLVHDAHNLVDFAFDTALPLDYAIEHLNRITDRFSAYRQPEEDKEYADFLKLVAEIKEIEQTTLDPSYKHFRLMKLSEKRNISTKNLGYLYLKYLASQENEIPKTIEDIRKEYGSNVQEWFMQGFAPKGSVVLLHALGGVGKTRLIYDWIYHMVTGQPWGGGVDGTGQTWQVTAPSRRVLIVQTDESQGDFLNAVDTRGFTDDMPVRVKTRWTADHMAALRKDIEDYKPEVILIDSLTSINRNSMFSENDTEYARPVLELRDLAQEFGCLIYLIHHSNSEGKSRGTKAIHNSVSHVLSLNRLSEGSDPRTLDRILCVEKSRSRAPQKYKLSYIPENSSWMCEGVEGLDDGDRGTKDRIIDFLKRNPNTRHTVEEILEGIGGTIERIRLASFQLAMEAEISRIKRPGRGGGYLYFLAFEGDRQPKGDRPENTPITLRSPSGDHLCKPAQGEALDPLDFEGDRPLCKKMDFEDRKNEKFVDPSRSPSGNQPTESDSKGDREGDRPPLEDDHLQTADRFQLEIKTNLDGTKLRIDQSFKPGDLVEYEGVAYEVFESSGNLVELYGIEGKVRVNRVRKIDNG